VAALETWLAIDDGKRTPMLLEVAEHWTCRLRRDGTVRSLEQD
jgi:hypothetical protein